jgi:hypothetical protein
MLFWAGVATGAALAGLLSQAGRLADDGPLAGGDEPDDDDWF